jgi:hypothetical protein
LSASESQFLESWFQSERIYDTVLADAALRSLTALSLGHLSPPVGLADQIVARARLERTAVPGTQTRWGSIRRRWVSQIEAAVAHPFCRAATGVSLFVTSLAFAVALVALAQAFAGTTPQELLVLSSGFAATFVELLTVVGLFAGVVVEGIGEIVSIGSGPGGLALATSMTIGLAWGLMVAIRNTSRTTVRVRD